MFPDRKRSRLERPAAGLCVLVGLTLPCVFFASQERPTARAQSSARNVAPSENEKNRARRPLIREGSQLEDQPGQFHWSGSRLNFVPTGSEDHLIALENLNLQRVAQILSERPDTLEWRMSGTVTEYRGVNYLLVQRVILSTASPRAGQPVP